MAVSYNKLWKILVDKKMSKSDLRKKAEIAGADSVMHGTIEKMAEH